MKKIISVLIVGIVLFLGFKILKERQMEDLMAKKPKIYPLRVRVFFAKESNVTLTLPYIAEVRSSKDILFSSKLNGRVLYIASLGKRVKKGESIIRIDDSSLRAKLKDVDTNIASIKALIDADRSNLHNLYLIHKRSAKLLKVKMVSIEQYENEEIKINDLKAKIKSQKEKLKSLYALRKSIINDLSYADIKAPFDGVVSEKFLNRGDMALLGRKLLKLSSLGSNYLFLTSDKKIKGIFYKGKFIEAKSLNTAFNSLIGYKIDVNDTSLLNGERVEVRGVVFRGDGTLLPFNTILSVGGRSYVFVVKDKKLIPKEVHIIASGKEGVVIKERINSKIIKANPDILLKIKSGYPVRIEDV